MRYRDGSPLVLRGVSLIIQAGEKIGVVGRTGAGKSSLTQVLLRLVQCSQGRVLIDGQDISKINVKDLRNQMTFVAQQPVLFSSSLRDNIDPCNLHSDEQITQVLRACCMDELLNDRGSLSTLITQGGSNLSIGQRQLLCLARAILRRSRIVLIDEATANIDVNTDRIVQKAIQERFRECTVLTIAHRINTVMHCDRIVVMGEGRILQVGSPKTLIEKGGEFASLYRQHLA